jgi:hypothetical protein
MDSKGVAAFRRPGAQAFREAVRRAPRLDAVIFAESHGISIELSDGRRCYWASEHCQFKRDIIGAALQWAHRHGATSVEIRDQ